MNGSPTVAHSLRLWLTAALLCVITLPPLAVWGVHAVSATTSGPDRHALAAARTYAVDNVARWTDPAWQAGARAYFKAEQIDVELRPANGAWFSTLATHATAIVHASDKFVASAPDNPSTILGSGWIIPHTTTRTTWTLPLIAGGLVLGLTVAVAGLFLGRHVVRPLGAISQAAQTVPRGETELSLPASRVTEIATVARALQTMGDDLRTAHDRQADMEEQRRQFIGAIAHDLRTPLFTLRAYLDGLTDGIATNPQKTSRYLKACRTSANALDRLITDLFTYARMEYLNQQPRREPVDLNALLRTAAQAHAPRADAKQVGLAVTAPVGGCIVAADEHLLHRVMDNLLDNALRHTPAQGRIELQCTSTETDATFTVTDTGPGIAPSDLPHLFTPLYRGESSRNRATGGAGLGLAIAQRIMQAHGGTLTAENATPHGARFSACLPIKPDGVNGRARAVHRDNDV